MKKIIIFSSFFLLFSTFVNAQTDSGSRKGKPSSWQTPPRNPTPINFKSAPQDANFFEISLSNSATINGRGIKETGLKGCNNCNIAGKIINPPSGNSTIPTEEELTASGKRLFFVKGSMDAVSSAGKKTSINVSSDGSWSANLPAGVYKLVSLVDGKEITIAENITVK